MSLTGLEWCSTAVLVDELARRLEDASPAPQWSIRGTAAVSHWRGWTLVAFHNPLWNGWCGGASNDDGAGPHIAVAGKESLSAAITSIAAALGKHIADRAVPVNVDPVAAESMKDPCDAVA